MVFRVKKFTDNPPCASVFHCQMAVIWTHFSSAGKKNSTDTIEHSSILCQSTPHDVSTPESVHKCLCIACGNTLLGQQANKKRYTKPSADCYFITDKYPYNSARPCQLQPTVRRSKPPSAPVSLRLSCKLTKRQATLLTLTALRT